MIWIDGAGLSPRNSLFSLYAIPPRMLCLIRQKSYEYRVTANRRSAKIDMRFRLPVPNPTHETIRNHSRVTREPIYWRLHVGPFEVGHVGRL